MGREPGSFDRDSVVGRHGDKAAEPWGGKAPRSLTRGFNLFILKAQAEEKRERFRVMCDARGWMPVKKAPRKYLGAPLLLPLVPRAADGARGGQNG